MYRCFDNTNKVIRESCSPLLLLYYISDKIISPNNHICVTFHLAAYKTHIHIITLHIYVWILHIYIHQIEMLIRCNCFVLILNPRWICKNAYSLFLSDWCYYVVICFLVWSMRWGITVRNYLFFWQIFQFAKTSLISSKYSKWTPYDSST